MIHLFIMTTVFLLAVVFAVAITSTARRYGNQVR
jgi:hypothetical protein